MGHFAIEQEEKIEKKYPQFLSYLKSKRPNNMMDAASCMLEYAKAHKIQADQIIEDIDPTYMTYLWMQHRVIYQLDTSLTEALGQQSIRMEDSEKLPCELLTTLPYQCISVEAKPFEVKFTDKDKNYNMQFSGRFYLTYAEETLMGCNALMGVWETLDGTLVEYYTPIVKDGTIKDTIAALRDSLAEGIPERDIFEDEARTELMPLLFAMQVVLYLQAQNADIQSVPIRKNKKKPNKKASTKSRVKPPRIVYVGYKVGKILRSYDEDTKSISARTGTPKRPHSRRGHWHHFWTGAKDKSEERKLILKWVAPTMVHGEQPNETTTVVKIKGSK